MNNRGGEGKRLGLPDIDDGFLFRLCEAAAAQRRHGLPASGNIELALRAARARHGARSGGHGRAEDLERHAAALRRGRRGAARRPVSRAVTGSPLYIVHTSSGEALDAALRCGAPAPTSRSKPVRIISLTTIDWEGGDIGKINPPLREAADCEALWEGVVSGASTRSATDHVHRDLRRRPAASGPRRPDAPAWRRSCRSLLSEGCHKRGLPLRAARRPDGDQPGPHHGAAHVRARSLRGSTPICIRRPRRDDDA